jgi:hypothetical protein
VAKLDLNYLKKKYGKDGWKNKKYRNLVSKILARNEKSLSGQVYESNSKNLEKVIRNAKDNKTKRIVIPPIKNVINDDVILRKSAERGKIITNTLRDKLVSDLRSVINENKMTIPTGVNASMVNNNLVLEMEKKLTTTFEGYIKKNPKFGGIPSNIHTIAVTEIRSTINNARQKYMTEVLNVNPTVNILKEWIHNRRLSKQPRKDHMALNGVTVGFNEYFEMEDGSKMLYPHDPLASPEQVIGCNCEIKYKLG